MLYRQRTLHTKHGQVETPVLFPVRNIGKRSSDNTPEYANSIPEFRNGMVNSRSIRDRESLWTRLQEGDSIREEMGVPEDTVLFADSGGFDFRSDSLDTTPEDTLETQKQMGADIFGTVDLPLDRSNRYSVNQERISKSADYALTASEMHTGDELLFASVHGFDPQTVRSNITYLEQHGEFDGYAIGSLVPIRTDYTKVTNILLAARRATEKHIHVYGLGGINYQPLLLYLGIDSFDSSSFIRAAGKRNYFVPGFGGQVLREIEELTYLPCPCPVCGSRTLAEVREDRSLLTQHNLWALVTELRRFRFVFTTDADIESYLDLRFQGNSVTKRAYRKAKQQVRRFAQ